MLELIAELPDGGAFISSLKATNPPEATPSEAVTELRARRSFRGWTDDRELLAQVRDLLAGEKNKPFPRPGAASTRSVGGRRVVDLEDLALI